MLLSIAYAEILDVGFNVIHDSWRENYENCIWIWELCMCFKIYFDNPNSMIMVSFWILFKVHSPLYNYTWLCMNYLWLWCSCCVDWKIILMKTLWTLCWRFTHIIITLWLKDNSHLLNLWDIMITCWFECLGILLWPWA